MRNSYSDNQYDILNVNDVLKETSINVLEKKENKILFEFGNDFFKFENNKLFHYPDFVSMRNDINFKDATNTDYGLAITDTISKSEELLFLKDYNLVEREDYIKEEVNKGILKIPFKVDPDLEKSLNKIKENKLPAKELEDVNKMVIALIDVVALMLNFLKANSVRNSKNKIIQDVLIKLNRKNAISLSKDYDTLRKVPEVKKIIDKYFEFGVDVRIDKDWANFKNKFSDLEKITAKALGDDVFIDTCQKISDSKEFQENIKKTKEKVNEILQTISNEIPDLKEELEKDKDNNINKIKEIHSNKFLNFFVEDLNLNPKNEDDILEFILANNFISKSLVGETDEDYDRSLNRFVSSEKQLENISVSNIINTINKISETVLKIDLDNNKELNIKR